MSIMESPKVQLDESSETRTKRLMDESVAAKGVIRIRLNAQIQDPAAQSYKGMPGYSIVFKASSPEMVELAFTAIEEALKRL